MSKKVVKWESVGQDALVMPERNVLQPKLFGLSIGFVFVVGVFADTEKIIPGNYAQIRGSLVAMRLGG